MQGKFNYRRKHEIREDDYTKAIKIRFDGKQEYKICSYRREKLSNKIRDNRIIMNKI